MSRGFEVEGRGLGLKGSGFRDEEVSCKRGDGCAVP